MSDQHAAFIEELTPEKLVAWRKECVDHPDTLFASGIVLALLDDIEAERSADADHLREISQAMGLPDIADPPWGALIELAKTQYAQLEAALTPASTGEALAAWKKLGLAMMFLADPQPLATADAENYQRLGALLLNLEHQLAAARRAAQRTERLPDRFCLTIFVNAGLTLQQASTALMVSRRVLEEAEEPVLP